jgi:AcrR family transcriptional regulator
MNQRNPQATHQKLVDAALTVFAQKGYASATVDAIVDQAGYSKGAFYTHFNSKEELFLLLLKKRSTGNIERVMERCPWEGDPVQWVKDVLRTLLGGSQNGSGWAALSIEFVAHGMRDPRAAKHIARIHREWREVIAGAIQDCKCLIDPDVFAAAIVAMIDGCLIQVSMEPDWLDMEDVADYLEPLIAACFQEDSA